ncbi:hypothetical protein PybrP1_012703, partial [[Pythium] brassicae (nom. inval.)]
MDAIVIHDSSSDDDAGGGDGAENSTPSAYEDAVKRALAMAASLTAGTSTNTSTSIANSNRVNSSASAQATPKVKAKAAKKTTTATAADGARKRPLAKSSRPWVAKSAMMTSEASWPPRQSQSQSHNHIRSHISSSHRGEGGSSRGSKGASTAAADQGNAGDVVPRRVSARGSHHMFAARSCDASLSSSQPKSAGDHWHDAADRNKTAYRKQTVVSGKTTDKQRFAQSSARPCEREQPRGPPLPSVRSILIKKKATKKTTVLLNLSPNARTHTDVRSPAHSVSSLSSLSSDDAVSREVRRKKKRWLAQQRDREQQQQKQLQQRRRRERDGDSDASLSSLSDDGSSTRYYCRKSAPVSTSSAAVFRHGRIPSPSSPSSQTQQRRHQPSPPPPQPSRLSQTQQPPTRSPPVSSCDDKPSSSKRQRRQLATRFHVDSVALDELQAQERELARFEREMRQLSSLDAGGAAPRPASIKKTAASARTVASASASVRRRENFFDGGDDSDVQVIERSAVKPLPRATRKFALNAPVQGERVSLTFAQQGHQPLRAESPGSLGQLSGVNAGAERKPGATSGDAILKEQQQPQQQQHLKNNTERAMRFAERLDSKRFVIHPTAYRGLGPSFLGYQTNDEEGSLADIERRVESLLDAELPVLERCRQRKVSAILREARKKVIAGQWKKIRPLTDSSGRQVTAGFVVAKGGNASAPERHQRRVVLELRQVGAISNFTTCVGVRSNVRVDDNPIVRFSSSSMPSSTLRASDALKSDDPSAARKYRVGAPADSEIGEYVLRLVVAQLGDSDRVLLSLKNILGFSQAFTDYTELKKIHDARTLAAQRISDMQSLVSGSGGGHDGCDSDGEDTGEDHAANSATTTTQGNGDLKSVELLFGLFRGAALQQTLSQTLSERLSPTPLFFESHHARRQLQTSRLDRIRNSASLGIRASASGGYDEVCGVYRDLFCRICYAYDCHEHGSEQPQPTRRDIQRGEFVYEYTGGVVSQDEAERRGSTCDKKRVSYLFDLNEDAVVDALRKGNKSKFMNHHLMAQNCSAK